MQQQDLLPEHPLGLYQLVPRDQADAVAYAFVNRGEDGGEPVQYPYKYHGIADDEVRIQISYTGLCLSDSHTARDKWGPCVIPCCPGHEVCGYVSKVGDNVTCLKLGDRVGCNPRRDFCGDCHLCKNRQSNICAQGEDLYNPYFGGYSTHIQLKAKAVYKLPAGFKEELGSPLLCAGLTLYSPLKRYLKRNGRCAIIGIGGLGHLGVQYAAKLGMTVTAFTSTPDKKDALFELGASHVASSIEEEDLKTHEGKYNVVVNTLGIHDPSVNRAYQRLTYPGGTYIQVGAPDIQYKMNIDHNYIVLNQIRIAGSTVGSYEETQEMLEFSHRHNIYPMVETFKFEEFPKAVEKLEKGRPRFRCVVNVLEWAQANGFEK